MKIYRDLSQTRLEHDAALTVGAFDGVHLGHRYLLETVLRQARQRGLEAGAVTFDPHPRELLRIDQPFRYLTSLSERLKLIEGIGLDFAVVVPFTPELILMAARDFVTMLVERLRMKALVVGKGFALGHKRQGNEEYLRTLGQEFDYELTVLDPYQLNGEIVSSSKIRQWVREGKVDEVAGYLGRFHSLSGMVVPGAQRGLGTPTANLHVWPKRVLPADGIYVSRADWGDGPRGAATSIGVRPTFGAGERTVEVHILDFEGDLSGKEISVELIKYLRPERRFESAEALVSQMREDVNRVREVLLSVADEPKP